MSESVFVWIGQALGVGDIRQIDEGYAAFLTFTTALLVSVVAFFVNAAQRRREYRNQNSSQFLAAQKDDILKALAELSPMDGLGDAEALTFIDAHLAAVHKVCRHFETSSVYMSTGYASERLLVRVEKGIMQRFFVSVLPFIRRERPNHPTVLEYFESLFIRVYFGRASLLSVFIGLVTRNHFLATRRAFRFYHRVLVLMNRAPACYLSADCLPALRGEMRRLRMLRYAILAVAFAAIF